MVTKQQFKKKLSIARYKDKMDRTKWLLEALKDVESDSNAANGHIDAVDALSDQWEHWIDTFYDEHDIMWWHWDAFNNSLEYATDIRSTITRYNLDYIVELAEAEMEAV